MILLFVTSVNYAQSNIAPFESSIQLLFDAENVLTQNNKVSSLIDQSIFSNDAIQTNSIYQPELIQDSLLGSIIHFGRSNESASTTKLSFSTSSFFNEDFTFFFVLKKSNIQNVVNYFLGSNEQGLIIGGTNAAVSPLRVGLFNNPDLLVSNTNIDTNWTILSFKSDSIFINSEFVTSNNGIVSNSSFNTIGTRPDSPSFFFHGDFLELILYNTSLGDTDRLEVEDYLREKYFPRVKLDPNQSCAPSNYQLQSNILHKEILWSTGDTTDFIDVDSAGTYWVTAIDHFNFTSSDTIVIGGIFDGSPSAIESTGICTSDSALYTLDLPQAGYHYLWNTGDTTNTIYAKNEGDYYVDIWDENACMLTSDTVSVTISNYTSTTHLPTSPTICLSGSLSLEAGAEETISYAWYSDASPNDIISIEDHIIPDETQDYWVIAQNEIGCVAIDTTSVDLNESTPSPVVGFSSSLACGGQEVLFMDTSVQEESTLEEWEWSTSDGQSSSLQNPAFTFEDFGDVLVSLKVFNDVGCSAFSQKQVTVHASPIVGLASYDNLCTNTEITFQDSSSIPQGSLNSWKWVLDGDTLTTQSPPNAVSRSFEDAGIHQLTQVVTSDSGCVSEQTTELDFLGRPISNFEQNTVCIGTPITLSATSDTTGAGPVFYEWIDQNGDYLGGAQNISIPTGNVDYPDAGIQYPVFLVTHTSDAYCRDTSETSNSFFVLESLPNVEVVRDTACTGQELILSASANGNQIITSYDWDVENIGQGNENTFSFVPSEEGYIHYSLLSSTQFPGCETLKSDSMKVYDLPSAAIDGPSYACLNTEVDYEALIDADEGEDMLSFTWILNNVISDNIDTTFSFLAQQPGLNSLELQVVNAGNCINTAIKVIAIYGASADFTYTQVCDGDLTTLIAIPDTSFSGPTQSEWIFENGDTIPGHSIAVELGAGNHWVLNSITDTEHNCVDIDSIPVKVSSYPIAWFEPFSVCKEEGFQVISDSEEGNDSINQTSWLLEDGSVFEGEFFSHTYTEAGDQNIRLVVVTAEAFCSDTLEQLIPVYELPMANFSFSPETGRIPLDVQFSNTSDSAFVYTWFLGPNDISFDPEPSYIFTDTGWVSINLIAETIEGCEGEKLDSIYTLPPKVDIEVIEVIPVWNGDYVSIQARVRNNGYYTVYEFESLTSIGSNSPLKMVEILSIDGEDFKLTNPSTSWYFNPAQTQEQAFACVEVNLSDGSKDELPGNDKLCVSLFNESFIVYDPFPNPGSEELNIRMNLPESGQLSVELYASNGEVVEQIEYNGAKGFNQVLINTAGLSAGTYTILVRFGQKEKSFSWVKG